MSKRVYVSSTFIDLEAFRAKVLERLRRSQSIVVAMEDYAAFDERPADKCLADVKGCDIYVGILAKRYGYIPADHNPEGLSITEMEYRQACDVRCTRLIFQLNPDAPWLDKFNDRLTGEGDSGAKIQRFRVDIGARHGNRFFSDPEELAGLVLEAILAEINRDPPATGDTEKADFSDASQEIDRYRQAVESLHASIPLTGFKTKLRVPIDLEDLYVPLQATVDLRGTGDSVFADASDAEAKLRDRGSLEISLMEAFRDAKQRKRRGVVILGDPGSGKTTHLKRLLLSCLRQGPEGLGLPAGTLPVFLPLRELEDLSKGIDAFVEKTLDEPHLKMGAGFGARLLDRGRLLLLFDGLDEVSDPNERARVARWLEGAAQARPTCTLVVTCRFAGYDDATRLNPDFLQLHLRPLTRELSESFIRNWYHAVETGLAPDPAQGAITARERAEELVERLRAPDFRSARMAEMTRNPLLLANLCLVHRDRHTLPHGRHELYDECIEVLLERWREGKALAVNVSAKDGRRVLQPAALWMHSEEGRTRATAQELAPVLEPALNTVQWRDRDASKFLHTVRDESGLLTGWGPDHYGFMHLGFQEYLTACELRRLAFEGDKDAVLKDLAGRYGESWWQEVILMVLAQSNPTLFKPFMRQALRHPRFSEATELLGLILEEAAEVSVEPFVELLQQPPGKDRGHWARQLTALQVLERLGADAELNALVKSLRHHPLGEIQTLAQARAQAAIRRTRVTEQGGVELVLIPGDTFRMGSPASDAEGFDDERREHDVQVPTFYLGRHPVTNEEYGRFLEANPDVEEPGYWGDRQFNQARQPVVGVSWEDAQRFAQWAGARLPAEAEWEYAARAGTTTRYWWGDEVGKNNANCDGCGSRWDGKHSSPVGSFQPNAFGLHDMLGNVWEWVQDCWHNNYEGAPLDGSAWEQQGGDCARRVFRGGSWFNLPRFVRSADRSRFAPESRFDYLGFRLAQDL
ncbi:MAG: SUMF1/EgtB/PvdO family nonheme iron enzyme [Gammaproteobacteria bacterium]